MDINLTPPQSEMFKKTCPFPLFVGGYSSGKSYTLITLLLHDIIKHPKADFAVYSPTYDLNRLNLEPRLLEALDDLGMFYNYNKSTAIVKVAGHGKVIFRSMDNPSKIIAYEVFRSFCDEIDTLPQAKANDVWNKIIARNRQRIYHNNNLQKNRISAFTTPEGYGFTYNKWGTNPINGYEYVKASTLSNPEVSEDYIQMLKDTYPDNLVKAYIEGEWCNLTSGSVYYFSRENHTTSKRYTAGDAIHIGADFNVRNMCWTIFIQRSGISYAVGEIVAALDTPECCRIVKERYPDSSVIVYPDASGGSNNSKSASVSDFTIIKQHGFSVRAARKNPRIKNRVNAVNAALEHDYIKVNPEECPQLALALEQQIYNKQGLPEKRMDDSVDDLCDGFGYYAHKVHPLIKPVLKDVSWQ